MPTRSFSSPNDKKSAKGSGESLEVVAQRRLGASQYSVQLAGRGFLNSLLILAWQ